MKRLHARTMALLVVLSIAGVGVAFSSPAGASDGGLIAFGSQRYGRTNNIFTMNANGSHVRQLTFMKKRDGADLRQQWSPDGTKLVFEHRNDAGTSRQLWVINADGTGKHRLLHDPDFLDFTPSYSPDGSRIAFERCVPDVNVCALFSIDAHGNDLTQITTLDFANEIIDGSPKYSPDGTTIAFSSFNRDGVVASIYLISATGGPITRLTPPELSAVDPDWSPDGSRLVFWSNCCVPGQPAIWTIGADGNNLLQVSHPGTTRFTFSPDYSPDGRRIAYERDLEDGTSMTITINLDGSNRTLIQRDAFLPVWQPIS